MEKNDEKHIAPKIAIAALIGGVALYDYLVENSETITAETRRTRQKSKLGNFIVQALIWTTAAHLSGVYEKLGLEDYDWIHRLDSFKRKV